MTRDPGLQDPGTRNPGPASKFKSGTTGAPPKVGPRDLLQSLKVGPS